MVFYHKKIEMSTAKAKFNTKIEMTLDYDLSPRSQGSLLFTLDI